MKIVMNLKFLFVYKAKHILFTFPYTLALNKILHTTAKLSILFIRNICPYIPLLADPSLELWNKIKKPFPDFKMSVQVIGGYVTGPGASG